MKKPNSIYLFETMLLSVSPETNALGVYSYTSHLKRLINGLIELADSGASELRQFCNLRTLDHKLREDLKRLLRNEGHGFFRLRVRVERGEIVVEVWPYERVEREGVAVVSFSGERVMPHLKSNACETSILGREFAKKNKAYEALLVDRKGFIREGAWTNFFWMDENEVWHTPNENILPGIQRGNACAYLREFGDLREDEALLVDVMSHIKAAFLTNALIGAYSVGTLDGKDLDISKCRFINGFLESKEAKFEVLSNI